MPFHNHLTITGNIVRIDPPARTRDGKPYLRVTIADSRRRQNPTTGAWENVESYSVRATLWDNTAMNAANCLRTGMRVTATGRLDPDSWTDRDGNRRHGSHLTVDDLAVSLTRGRVTVNVERANNANNANNASTGNGAPTPDPWAGVDPDEGAF